MIILRLLTPGFPSHDHTTTYAPISQFSGEYGNPEEIDYFDANQISSRVGFEIGGSVDIRVLDEYGNLASPGVSNLRIIIYLIVTKHQ